MCATYTIGLDYGTLSGRGVLVRCCDGAVMARAVHPYRHGVMDCCLPDGRTVLPGDWALQNPRDYVEALEQLVPELMRASGVSPADVIGMGMDFTACTVLPVDRHAVPLCEQAAFGSRPHAYVKLWKHHGAQRQADRISRCLPAAGAYSEIFQAFKPGTRISSELMLPKVMELIEADPQIYEAADEILEAGDWLTRLLTDSHKRSGSMAGYKAWWHHAGGYPEPPFYKMLDPRLEFFVRDKAPGAVVPVGGRIGVLNAGWAEKLGLRPGIAVAPTVIDSHAGVPGCGIFSEHQGMLVLGTSSVLIGFSRTPYSDQGICGDVLNGIMPGYYALESGLASVGDLFSWFVTHLVPADYYETADRRGSGIHAVLSAEAARLRPGESGLMALDWWNGNKTPFVDGRLTGALFGLTSQTRPAAVYRALVEATAYGTRRILEQYERIGLDIETIVCSGGIARKNPWLMQVYADVLGKVLRVSSSDQTAALGAAVYAALSAGAKSGGYDDYPTAVRQMGSPSDRVFRPNRSDGLRYNQLYSLYCDFSKTMGQEQRTLMHRLRSFDASFGQAAFGRCKTAGDRSQ